MEKTDPLAGFLIQHIGTPEDPFQAWGLNSRARDGFAKLMTDSGFSSFEIHSDAEYPDREAFPSEIRDSVDILPARVAGHSIIWPMQPEEILVQRAMKAMT